MNRPWSGLSNSFSFLLSPQLYSSSVASFRSFETSMGTLLGVLGGRTNFSPFFDAQRVLTHLFFLSFAFLGYGIALCLSLAVLTWSVKQSREQMSYKTTLDTRDYEMIDFMLKRFKLLAGIDKPKPVSRVEQALCIMTCPTSPATSSDLLRLALLQLSPPLNVISLTTIPKCIILRDLG